MARELTHLAAAHQATLDAIERFTELSPDERQTFKAAHGARYDLIVYKYTRAHDSCVANHDWQRATSTWQRLLVQLVK
jgi:hypothetical protein